MCARRGEVEGALIEVVQRHPIISPHFPRRTHQVCTKILEQKLYSKSTQLPLYNLQRPSNLCLLAMKGPAFQDSLLGIDSTIMKGPAFHSCARSCLILSSVFL